MSKFKYFVHLNIIFKVVFLVFWLQYLLVDLHVYISKEVFTCVRKYLLYFIACVHSSIGRDSILLAYLVTEKRQDLECQQTFYYTWTSSNELIFDYCRQSLTRLYHSLTHPSILTSTHPPSALVFVSHSKPVL